MKRMFTMLFALTLLNLNYSCSDDADGVMLESNAIFNTEIVDQVKTIELYSPDFNKSSRSINLDINDVAYSSFSEWVVKENVDVVLPNEIRESMDSNFESILNNVKEKQNLTNQEVIILRDLNNNIITTSFEEAIFKFKEDVSELNLFSRKHDFYDNYIESLELGYYVYPELFEVNKNINRSSRGNMTVNCAWATGALVLNFAGLASGGGTVLAAVSFSFVAANWGRVCLSNDGMMDLSNTVYSCEDLVVVNVVNSSSIVYIDRESINNNKFVLKTYDVVRKIDGTECFAVELDEKINRSNIDWSTVRDVVLNMEISL